MKNVVQFSFIQFQNGRRQLGCTFWLVRLWKGVKLKKNYGVIYASCVM